MTDVALRYRLLTTALPNEEKRIQTSYVPTLALVAAASTVLLVALGISKGATAKLMITYGQVMAVYIAYLVIWYPRRMKRKLTGCWETYELGKTIF